VTPDHVVFYDADCGLCRWLLAKVLAWDRRRRLRPVALQDPAEADRLLGGSPADRRMASWHLVTPDGRVHSAGAAVPPLLRALPGGRPLARIAGAVQPATDRAYRFVADNRSTFGRLLTAGARRRAAERVRLR
jgi:predicted DCC family thiol-disulfide oxidoreductase YuxK